MEGTVQLKNYPKSYSAPRFYSALGFCSDVIISTDFPKINPMLTKP